MDIVAILKGLTIAALPIILAITMHEVAHGWTAYKLGDPTAKSMGRLTLNPLAHIDPVGTVLLPIILFILSKGTFMFGSAKPVPVNFNNLRNPKRDMALVAAAGPFANVLISIISLVILRVLEHIFVGNTIGNGSQMVLVPVFGMLEYSIIFNIFLAAFNLLPIPPLDGGRIVVSLLPHRQAYEFSKVEPYGIFIVLILWFTGIAKYIIAPIQIFIVFIVEGVSTILGRIL